MKSSKKVSILSLLVILSSLASCNGNLPGSTASPATPNSTISPTAPKPTPSSTVTKEEFNITTDVEMEPQSPVFQKKQVKAMKSNSKSN